MIADQEVRTLFRDECEEKIQAILSSLDVLESSLGNNNLWDELLRNVHTVKGSARMLQISTIEILTHRLEDILFKIKKQNAIIDKNEAFLLREIIGVIQIFLMEETEGIKAVFNLEEFLRKIDELGKSKLEISKLNPALEPNEPKNLKESKSISLNPTVRVHIDQIYDLLAKVSELALVKTSIENLLEGINESYQLLEKKNIYKEQVVLEDKAEKIKEVEDALEEKLFKLRNDAYYPLHKFHMIFSNLASDLRELSLIPIHKLFDLFPAMTRNLAKDLGKDVELIIDCGPIGIERKIIESLKDPLMHILRNAISHGIESPKVRIDLGKEPKGKVIIRTQKNNEFISIEIEDDGAGLDIEKIKNQAIEKKLVAPEALASMTPEEIINFVFLPGFSTTTEVSDISGRGVGLDVVQNAIESLEGKVQITSTPAVGMKLMIELPISYLTTHVMLIEQDKQIFAIPTDLIEQCAFIKPEQILFVNNQTVIYSDSEPWLVFWLSELLEGHNKTESNALTCLFLKKQQKKMVLLIDKILEEEEIIISESWKTFFKIDGIMGATILKRGDICLALNPFELIKTKPLI